MRGNHRSILMVAAVLWMLNPAVASPATSTEISTLLDEVGGAASVELAATLQEPSLLPSDGIHAGTLFWQQRVEGIDGGALALLLPPGVRAGRELQRLQEAGVLRADSALVRRLLNAWTAWSAAESSGKILQALGEAEHLIRKEARERGVRSIDAGFTQTVLAEHSELLRMVSVSELSRSGESGVILPMAGTDPDDPPAPGPGELWCYALYKFQGWDTGCCGAGSDCWIRRPCPFGGGAGGGFQHLQAIIE
jgi:hypothetical protein